MTSTYSMQTLPAALGRSKWAGRCRAALTRLLLVLLAGLTSLAAQAQFAKSYTAGTRDPAGNFMGGTEMRVLATHKGKLFGGIETWKDDTLGTCDPFIGAMLVRLDAPTGPWRLDKHFNTFFPMNVGRERKRNEGVTALESLVFRTDQLGNPLPAPDTVLMAACRDFTGVLSVYTRNDATGAWFERQIGTVPTNPTGGNDNDGTIRSFIGYRDKVTGVDRVFAGSLPNGLISGAYDASQPGKIQWNPTAELTGFVGRPMAFTVCNGDLYCAIAPSIYKRTDGPTPTWTAVFTYPFTVTPGGSSGLRGLSTVPNPSGPGQALLAALEGNVSRIYRITPQGPTPYPVVTEYDVDVAMSAAFGLNGNYYVVANSEMTWVTEPVTNDSVLTITIQHHPANVRDDAFYLLRKQVGTAVTYQLKRIDNTVFAPLTVLNSTRAVAASPFAGDGNYVYVAGYDADDNVTHNAAYVLRAHKNAFLGTTATPVQAGLKRHILFPSLTAAGLDDTFGNHLAHRNTAVAPRNKLFVFLPGSGSEPGAYDEVQKLAAEEGYHALGLAYSNVASLGSLCAGSADSLCFDKVRGETIDGIDRTPLVTVSTANSINNRLLKALQYLNANFPAENWGQFYAGSTILWNKIVLGGHSRGGGDAAFIAKTQAVDKVLLFAAPKDYFTAPLRRPAAWIRTASATPACRYVAFTHQADAEGCTPAQQLASFALLGLSAYGSPVPVETSPAGYAGSHTLLGTRAGLTSAAAHSIVVADLAAATVCKVPLYQPVWRYMLSGAGCSALAARPTAELAAATVYPNPFVDRIVVADAPARASYTLTDALGRCRYQGPHIEGQSFAQLPPGLYLLTIEMPDRARRTTKLLKL